MLAGAIASALSLVAALIAGLKHWRQRQLRGRLGDHFVRLLRLDRRLIALATETQGILADGVGWHGIAISPPQLRGHLVHLEDQIDELERSKAQVRALPTRDANDRLRETIEAAIDELRTAFLAYRDGIWQAYRDHGGKPIPPGATGRGPIAALEHSHEEVAALRSKMELAVRTAAYQLDAEHIAGRYVCRWPTIVGELPNRPSDDLWAGETRPVTHHTLRPHRE